MKYLGTPMPNNKQQGLALITVLFIFALVSLLAVSMQQRQVLSIAQASATFSLTQAQLLAISAEDIAKAGLTFDGKRDDSQNEHWDSASELWNQPFPAQLAEAKVFITIRDLQGLFNVNSLSPNAANNKLALSRFQRLLFELNIDQSIAQNTKDWLTPDSQASSIYQNYEPAYSASGMEFSHPSELLLIEGMDKNSFLKLEPYITALPAKTPYNINTTDGIILQAWDTKLSLDDANTVVNKTRAASCGPKDRGQNLYKTVDEFWQEDTIKNRTEDTSNPAGTWEKGDFDVKTQYFSAFIRIELDDRDLILESIIRRDVTQDTGFIGTVYRDFSRKVEDISRLKIINCS